MCFCNMCYGWYRYRNLPVLTTNKTGSFIQHRYDHIRNIQIIHTYCYCSNIYNGIYSTNFMKMNFFDRNSMRFGFCLRQYTKYTHCHFLCSCSHFRLLNDLCDFFHSTMFMRMLMTMRMSMMMFMIHLMTVFMMPCI